MVAASCLYDCVSDPMCEYAQITDSGACQHFDSCSVTDSPSGIITYEKRGVGFEWSTLERTQCSQDSTNVVIVSSTIGRCQYECEKRESCLGIEFQSSSNLCQLFFKEVTAVPRLSGCVVMRLENHQQKEVETCCRIAGD